MTHLGSRLVSLVIDAHDPALLAGFWAGVLQRELVHDPVDGPVLLPDDDLAFPILFEQTSEPKRGPNNYHFDLTSSSLADQQATVTRALDLGGSHLDVGQGPDADHVVLADPEGNEFCVIEHWNRFLAGTGRIGALSGEGSPACGRFWSAALGWPLVWDQDEETAVQSPLGGTKITWGGPPYSPKAGKYRWHLDVAPGAGTEQQDEVDRLLTLGASHADIGQGDVPWVVLADPDGHEFCLLTPRS